MTTNSFPSHFVSMKEKSGPDWNRNYIEAFHKECNHKPSEYGILRNNSRYSHWKRLSRGENSADPYKELIGLKRTNGKFKNAYRNIDFKILKVGPKIKNVVVNKVVNADYKIQVKPIDASAMNERRKQKSKLLEFVVSQEEIKRYETLTKMGLERPVGPGEAPPSTAIEIEPFMDMNPRNIQSMEIKDKFTETFYENDWSQLSREIVGDLYDFGVAGTFPVIGPNGRIKIQKIDPERAICNNCIYPDFRDLIRFGTYREMTISDLRLITKGSLGPEQVYMDIANKIAGQSPAKYTGLPESHYNTQTYSYAYDVEKITVLDAVYYSTDTETYKEFKNKSGNTRVVKQDFNYIPFLGDKKVNDGKGMTDAEFNQKNATEKIYRKETKNVYKCSWIVDTDFVFNYGLYENMPREVGNLWETTLPVCLISTDFISTSGIIEQGIDQVQLNYLQYQNHVSNSRPRGVAIEKNALARLQKGTKKKFDPKEALEMYSEGGNLVFDGMDQNGQPMPYMPFKEIENGLSPAALEHFQLIRTWIDFIRFQVGLNPLTEGEAPPERLGKGVAQLSFGASDNALLHLNDAFRKIYERTSKLVFSLFQASMNLGQVEESLGRETALFWQFNNDLPLRDMGIMVVEGPDQYIKDKISVIVQRSIDAGQISGEDGIYVEMEENIYRALLVLAKKKREREKQAAAAQEQNMRIQGEENTKTAVATQQSKDEGELKKIQAQQQLDAVNHERELQIQDRKFLQDLIMKKMDTESAKEMNFEDADRNFVLEILKLNTPNKAA